MNTEKKSHDLISRVFRSTFFMQIMTMLAGIAGNLVDGAVTGKFLGEDAIAAFGFTSAVSLTVAVAGSVLSTGTAVVCTTSLGRGELEKSRRVFASCFGAALIVSAILALLMIMLAVPVAKITGAEGSVIGLSADYIRGYGIACPLIILISLLLPIMQIDGEMNRLLIAVVLMTVGDIAADLLNVMVFHGGMFGMALATAISYLLAFLVLLPHFFKQDVIFCRLVPGFEGRIIGDMLKKGSPMALSQFGRLLLTFILNRYLMRFWGVTAVAAHAVIMLTANLCMVPGTALGSSTELIAGVLNGEEDRLGICRLMSAALRFNLAANGGCALVLLLSARPIISLFYQGDSASMALAAAGFRFYVLSMVFYGMNLIYRSYCQGTGQTARAYAITICDGFLGPLFMAFLLGSLFGVPALWLCYVTGEGLTSALMLAIFRKNSRASGGMEAYIPFPRGFGEGIEASMELSANESNPAQAAAISERAASFCASHGAGRRTAFLAALAIEESVRNVMEYGFSDGKAHSVDLRLLKKSTGWLIRVRDDCALFDPKRYIEQYSSEDPARNIGLKLIRGIADEMTYVNTLKLNNLTIRISEAGKEADKVHP